MTLEEKAEKPGGTLSGAEGADKETVSSGAVRKMEGRWKEMKRLK